MNDFIKLCKQAIASVTEMGESISEMYDRWIMTEEMEIRFFLAGKEIGFEYWKI